MSTRIIELETCVWLKHVENNMYQNCCNTKYIDNIMEKLNLD